MTCVVPVALILFIVQDIWGILNFLYRYSTQSSSVLCIRLVVTTCVNIKLILIELNNHFENEHKMSAVLSARYNIFVTHFQLVSDCCLMPSEQFFSKNNLHYNEMMSVIFLLICIWGPGPL